MKNGGEIMEREFFILECFFIFHFLFPVPHSLFFIFSPMNDIIEKFLKQTVWIWLPFVALVKLSKAAIAKMFPKKTK